MKEVEVKAKVTNLEEIKHKLTTLGCTFSNPLIQKDKVFLKKGLTLKDHGKGLVALRIRDENGTYTMTMKKQVGDGLDKIEKEIIIDDPKQGEDIILHMGFHEVSFIQKTRTKCKYNDYEICLDSVTDLGNFIEVEKLTTQENSKQIQNEMFAFLESLDVKEEQRVFKGYDILMDELSSK